MALVQIARTPRTEYPTRLEDIPFAFAFEIRQPTERHAPFAVVRCPWCGDAEQHANPRDDTARPCLSGTGGTYIIAVPSGTPVLAPRDFDADTVTL